MVGCEFASDHFFINILNDKKDKIDNFYCIEAKIIQ